MISRFLYTIVLLMLLASCSRNNPLPPQPDVFSREQWIRKEAESLATSLDIRQKAAQVLITGIDGNEAFPAHLWKHFNGIVPGAIVLFRYNIADTPGKVHSYIASCTRAFETMGGVVTPLFAIDHEGGLVFRLSGITAPLPSAQKTSELFNSRRVQELLYHHGLQLKTLGITMNLAPVAEVLNDENRVFLSSRSYGTDTDIVGEYVSAAVRGYRDAGIIPVVKHFPGNSATDPHTGVSTLNVSPELFDAFYLDPFRMSFAAGASAVLLSHVVVPGIDPHNPFCLSHDAVTGLLREKESFSGLIMTDDISMEALTYGQRSSVQNAIDALNAGCDMIMTSDTDINRIVSGITLAANNDKKFERRLNEAVTTILELKISAGITPTARESCARSRLGKPVSVLSEPFCLNRFTEAYRNANLILENHDEHSGQ